MSARPGTSVESPTPLVSVIVPSFNYGHVVGQTLESLLAQTYPHWECVVVDDGSPDDTGAVVARYAERDRRVVYVRQENAGVAAARNNGIARSRGEYVQFLDADDLIEARKLELHVAYLEAHPEVDIVYGGVRFFRTERPEERLFSMSDEGARSSYLPVISAAGEGALRVLVGNMIPVNAPVTRRRVVERAAPFDVKLNSVEDADFWIRCAAQGARFQYHDPEGTLALVRSHPASASKNRRKHLGKMIEMRAKVERTLTDPEARAANRKAWAEAQGYLGVEQAAAGSPLRGALSLLKAAALSRDARERAKWVACSLAAPFVPEGRLKKLPATPISRWLRVAPESRAGAVAKR
ncbi:MAG TPA: glycosyltransferase family A protein [Pyrinomonadaceae bacterium]